MRLMEISTDDAKWEDFIEPKDWVRVEINGVWFDLSHGETGLMIRTERPMVVRPKVTNSIEIEA